LEDNKKEGRMTKSDTLKLPKRIAGVKVPKVLRRPGTIVDFLNSPVGRLVLAEALIAAAAALKNYKPVAETMGEAANTVEKAGIEAASTAKDFVQSAAGGLADVAAGVVRQIVPASSGADDQTDHGLERRGKPKKDIDSETPSTH
jgi:hypothetical protein